METYSLRVKIDSDVSGFMSGLSGIGGELQNFEKEVDSTLSRVGDSFKRAGTNLQKVGAGLTAGLTVPLTMVGKSIFDTGMEFEEQMGRVKAIGQLTDKEFKKLDDQAIQVGADTIFGATDVGLAQEELLKKGFDIDEVQISIPGVMDLATISGKDVGLAADTMSSILNAYKLDKGDSNRITDILAQASVSSALDVRDIGDAMSYVGAEASDFNMTLEETTAMLGIMADNGIDGSKGGTQLRAVLKRLRTPTKKAGEMLDELGVSAYDSTGKVRPIFDVLKELEGSMKGLNKAERDTYIDGIFGAVASTGVKTLLGNMQEVDELHNKIVNSEGVGAEVGEDLMDNTAGTIEEMQGAIESAQIEMFRAMAPIITDVANAVADLADKFSNLPEPIQQAIGKAGIFLAVLGPLIATLGLVIDGLGSIMGLLGKFKGGKLFGGAFGKALAVVGTILAVVAAGWLLVENWELIKEKAGELGNKIGEVFDGIKENVAPVVEYITDKWDGFKESISENMPELTGAVESLENAFSGLGRIAEGAFDIIAGGLKFALGNALSMLVLVGGLVRAIFTGDWEGYFATLGDTLPMMGEGIGQALEGLIKIGQGSDMFTDGIMTSMLEGLNGLWTMFTDWTEEKWMELIVWVAEKLDEVWTKISTWWNELLTGIDTWWQGVQDKNSTWFETLAKGLADWLLGLWDKFIEWKDGVLNTISEWWDGVVEKFTSLTEEIRTKVDEIKTTVSDGFEEAVDNAVEWVSELPGRIRGFFDDMKSAGANLVSGFISGLKSDAEGVWNAAKNMGSNAVNAITSRLDINSPSRVAEGLGIFVGEGFINGIEGMYAGVRNASEGLGSVVENAIGRDGIGGFVSDINGMVAHTVGASVEVENMGETKQPIIIQTRFGNEDYEVYVDDITRQQDKVSWIKRR